MMVGGMSLITLIRGSQKGTSHVQYSNSCLDMVGCGLESQKKKLALMITGKHQ